MTSSPALTSMASRARYNAAVQLDTAQAYLAPTQFPNSFSKAATSGPCVTHPDKMARRAASASASSSHGRAIGISLGLRDVIFAPPCLPVIQSFFLKHLFERSLMLQIPLRDL